MPLSVSLTPSFEECAEVAAAGSTAEKGKHGSAGPPGLIVTNAAGEVQRIDLPKITLPQLQFPRPDKGKRVISCPPGSINAPVLVVTRGNEALPQPMLNRSRRVLSGPPGRPARPLRLPQKLAGTAQGRWSDVPATWRHDAVDPLRCHSVDHLPQSE